MLLFLCSCLLLSESYGWDWGWIELNSYDGVISFSDNNDYRKGWTNDCYNYADFFTLNEDCCNNNNMKLLINRNDEYGKYINFNSNSDSMTMNSLTIINTDSRTQHVINTDNMKNGLIFYFGCFETTYYSYNGTVYTCRTSVNSDKRTLVDIYSSSFILFGDSADQLFTVRYHEITSDQFYVFIGGVGSQSIDFDFQPSMSDSYLTNGVYYLFTTDQNVKLVSHVTTSSYVITNICSRKDIFNRYGIVKNLTTINDCSCTLNNEQTYVNLSTSFNYPDCNYNSSTLDLTLPTNSNKYSLSDDLLIWYSIIFTTLNQSIEINKGQTLKIDELNIIQENISFNENVYVTDLTITTPGSSFNTLNFENIDTSNVNPINVVFTIESTDTDLSSYNLEMIGNGVYLISLCIYNEENLFYDRSGKVYDDCSTQSETIRNTLSVRIDTTTYTTESDEYWNYLNINKDNFTIIGVAQLKANVCEFEDKTITINGDLNCTTMNINLNTKLVVNGELSIGLLVITGEMNDNLNENGIIESYGSIKIISIEIKETQSNCIELISSSLIITKPLINSNYLTLLLSQNHLLRICPSSSTNYEVTCTTIGNTFEQQSFDLLHCPCIDSNCIINVTTTQLDGRNIEFSGIFNILTNSSIAILNQTSSFIIEYENDKQILLIGNEAIGFYQSRLITNIKTTTLAIQSSNQLPCKALLIENEKEICIVCDGNFNIDGYCTYSLENIKNCKLKNDIFGCSECYEGYESNVTNCNKCPSNCLRCYNGYCINCEMNYYVNGSGGCSSINEPITAYKNEKVMKCNDGYYSNGNDCIRCLDLNCVSCNSSTCLTCNNSININDNCRQMKEEGEEIIYNNGIIECNDGYYLINNECLTCSSKYNSNCELCDSFKCYSCLNGVLINNSYCVTDTDCEIEDSLCLSCNDKGSWFNGNECISCGDNCKNCVNGKCIECNNGYILQSENNCIENEYPDNCKTLSYHETCQRCSDGYYLNNNKQECNLCPEHCTSCHNLTYCYSCNEGYMILDDICVLVSLYLSNCKTAIPGSSGGCAICNNGYYRNQTTCKSCISNCTKCNNGESCLICESNYFLLNDASECISYNELTNCETKTQSGCTKCLDGYYLNNQYCTSCDSKTNNCSLCENIEGKCTSCQNDYILINYECINYQLINNCKESNDSKCSSCSFWHTLNEDRTGCDTQVVWWVIVLIILFILMVLIGICVLMLYVIKKLLDWRKQQKQRKQTTIFDMKTSNVQFKSTNNQDVVINKNEILFDDESDEIGVNEETRDLICVGNTSKHTIKVQFSVKDGCDKYEIRTNPQLITIPKGKACEFEIFIKPLCTCSINDQIMLISVDLTKGKTISTPITINTITIMTTRLNYSELIEDIKLGEGSFGIVYKGTFRGKKVAIKKLKQAQDNKDQIKEFNKEVQMLDKFRNDYIVHFYGAVFIPNKICMVTELAQYGSLQDLFNKRKDNSIDNTMKMKIVLDCSKGISYLHSNGILHRDIKPDNFLILSLDTNVQVNAKLTDFGSSRNINMMMTNMTFTKGIGTPVYMAPEILKNGKYKKSADIYSFAITIYETMIWEEAYQKDKFKFPWKIAEFVTNGERLPKPSTMNDSIYSLITNCWKQEPKERLSIEIIIEKLEEMN